MHKYLITEEESKEILQFLKEHKSLELIKFIKNLKPYENPLVEELRRFLMNKGKSTILHLEIQDIIDKNENK